MDFRSRGGGLQDLSDHYFNQLEGDIGFGGFVEAKGIGEGGDRRFGTGQKEVFQNLDEVSHVHGHLLNSGVVECLDVPQRALVLLSNHVDGNSLAAKTTPSTNPDR